MNKSLSYYTMLARRWAWMIVLGIVICSGATFTISKLTHPVYQASATLILNLGTTASAYDNVNASLQAVPTYAQLVMSPEVLTPVVARHPGLTLEQLGAMITVNTQPNTQLIVIDVENSDPQLAMQLANEVSQSFAAFANAQLPSSVLILPAQKPIEPIRPKVLHDTGIGALVGLVLALALIVIFEWIDDRLANPEEVRELLGAEILALIPRLSRKQRTQKAETLPSFAEGYRMLATRLNIARKVRSFKLVMVTGALSGEGKSTIAANLASFLAASGQRVLLVDANLNDPALAQYFQIDNHPGLADVFMGDWAEVEGDLYGQPTDIPNLFVLAAGVPTSSSIDLLQLWQVDRLFEHFAKAPFDYVIFDTPPLLSVANAQVWTLYAQAIVVVVDASKTPRKVLLRLKDTLTPTRSTILGAVINKSRWTERYEIRQHLSNAQQRRKDVATATIMSHRSIPMAKLPDTPPVNGLRNPVDPDATVVLPGQRPVKGDQS